MHKLNSNKTGLTVGAFMGLFHLVWALMVKVGMAATYLNFIFGLHFLSNPYAIQSFSWGGAVMLVIVTAIVGYVFGSVFAWLWNWLHKN